MSNKIRNNTKFVNGDAFRLTSEEYNAKYFIYNVIGAEIKNICNKEELINCQVNEYGNVDYRIFRNIFDIDTDTWIDGLSHACLETQNGIVISQINCI